MKSFYLKCSICKKPYLCVIQDKRKYCDNCSSGCMFGGDKRFQNIEGIIKGHCISCAAKLWIEHTEKPIVL